ncbi:MAG: NADH-quinone oxidoreductase subunit G [Acidimicrobiia bacterium]|nr:MAG: NADH-quinone oxidoreductase subunit G [Acidimicrobiia bacterium]
MSEHTVRIVVDGRELEVPKGELVIKAAQDNGTYIPRFCWHPRMKPVGMCRMCLVFIDSGRGPMLTTACTTPVADGMKVDTTDPAVKKAQEGILEFLLINHPLDCPVCDRGGECPLQDQTMAYGPGESRFVEEKRHFEKPIPISDLVMLDRERCILCARCTRFSEEVSGDPLIEFLDRGYHTEVNTFPDHPFRSYFSGNTVQICPVGALTATLYRFRARPWDLVAVESTCTHCTAGDRIVIQASQNEILRFLGVDAEATNQGWLSDKCRFGFGYINSDQRLTVPLIRDGDGFREATWGEALDLIAQRLGDVIRTSGPDAVAALGGARGTNEDAYALSKFMRTVVGSNNLDCRMDDTLDAEFLAATVDRALISDIDRAKTILVWGPDLKEEHPTLYLRVRRAAIGSVPGLVSSNSDAHLAAAAGATLVVVHPRATGLDPVADFKLTYRPGSGAELLAQLRAGEGRLAEVRAALAEGPVVALVGRTGSTEDPRLAEAVAAFVRTLPDAKILPLARRANTYGALDMGVAPTLLPGRVSISEETFTAWGDIPRKPGRDCRSILEGALAGDIQALLLVGADPVRDVPDGDLADRALDAVPFLVAVDLFLTDSAGRADVVLPADGFGEKEGTVTNLEGRVQKVNAIVPGAGQSRPDWSILDDLARRMGSSLGFGSAEAIAKEIAEVAPAYRGVTWDVLDWEARDGVVVPGGEGTQPLVYLPADTPGPIIKADLVLHSARTMYDDGVTMRHTPHLHRLAPGAALHVHPDDAARLGLGFRARVVGSSGSATLPVVTDPSLARGVVYVPFNQPGCPPLGSDPRVTVEPA